MKKAIQVGLVALTAFGFAALGCGNNSDGGGGAGATGSGSNSTGGTSSATSSSNPAGGTTGSSSTPTGGTTGASGSSAAACSTTNGSYSENTTFATDGSTAPYQINQWGTWGDATVPTLTQTTTGPTGLDCSSGCAVLTINFSNGTAQYSAATIVEYFGSSAEAVENLLNQTITAKIAVTVAQAAGATAAAPISISLFGQDTSTSTNGVDNVWVKDLGTASSLDAANGWHTVTNKVVDARVPSWSPTRTVCASGLHDIGISIQNNSAIAATNGAVVTLYVQSVSVGAS